MKKLFSLFLVLLTVLSAFAACSAPQAPQSEPATKTGESQQTATQEQTSTQELDQWGRPYIPSALPEDLNFGGKTVNIFIDKTATTDWFVEDYNDELINDSVYDRNIKVEEDLGVKLNFVVSETVAGSTAFLSEVDAVVSAGTNDFDIVSGWGYFLTTGVRTLTFANLYDIPNLHLESAWWNQSYIEEATLANQLYTVVGDLTLSTSYQAGCLFFNKRLADEEYASLGGADHIYQLVLDGKWTIDKFTELVKDKYRDLDSDGVPSEGDFYGLTAFMSGPIPANAFQFGMEAPICKDNEEGIPEFVMDSQKTVDVLHKLYVLCTDCEGVMFDTKYYNAWGETGRIMMINKFINGTTIFYPGHLALATSFLDMTDDYGILPMPKYDEAQQEYHTAQSDDYNAIAIPYGIDVSDRAEMVGATLEKLCEESYRTVNPNYFEVVMKYRYIRSDSEEDHDLKMYDLILAGNGFDFGLIFSNAMDDPSFAFRHILGRDGSENFASYWGAKDTNVKKLFNGLITWFTEE